MMTKELKPLYRVVYPFSEDDPIDPDYFDDLSSAILKMMENFFVNEFVDQLLNKSMDELEVLLREGKA